MKKFKILFLTISFILTFNFVADAMEKTNTSLLNSETNDSNTQIEKIENNFKKIKELVDEKTYELQNLFGEIKEDEISLINLQPNNIINKKSWSDEELKNIDKNFKDQKKQSEFIQKKLESFDAEWEKEGYKKYCFIENYKKKIYKSLAKVLETGVISTKTTADYALVFNKLVNIFNNLYKANNTLFQIMQLKEVFQNDINVALEQKNTPTYITMETPRDLKNKRENLKETTTKKDILKINSILDAYNNWCSIMNYEKYKKYLDILITIYIKLFSACECKYYDPEVLANLNFEEIEQQNINKLKLNISTELTEEDKDNKKYNSTHIPNVEKIADEITENIYFDLEKIMQKEGLKVENYCFVNNVSNLKHIFNSINEINYSLLKILKNPETKKDYEDFEEIAKNATSCKDMLDSNKNEKISTNVLQKAIVCLIKSFSKKAEFDSKTKIQKIHKSIMNTKNEKSLMLMIELHDKILDIIKNNNFNIEEKNEFTPEDIIKFSNEIKTTYKESLNLASLVALQSMLNLWESLIYLFLLKDGENKEINEIKDFIKKEQSKVYVNDDDYDIYYN